MCCSHFEHLKFLPLNYPFFTCYFAHTGTKLRFIYAFKTNDAAGYSCTKENKRRWVNILGP